MACYAQRPAPPPAQIEADIAKLRACVQARCAALLSAAAGGEPPGAAAEEDASFKWDRECEEALHTVVLNHIAAGTGCVLARITVAAAPAVHALTALGARAQQAQVRF
jgi:hypothetical protein